MLRNKGKLACLIVLFGLAVMLSVGCFLGSYAEADDQPGQPLGIPSLKEIYKDYFEIGAAVNLSTINTHRNLIDKHFSSLTAENEMKPEGLQRTEGRFSFQIADRIVNLAVDQGMKMRGHTLVWHAQTPSWFFQDKNGNRIDQKSVITEEDRQLVRERLETHIENVMQYYAGRVYAWDVVNEAVSDDGRYILRQDSPWFKILGEEFLEIAFRKAHEVDPNAKLFYNDYNIERPYKLDRTVQLLKSLLDKGVPIHGVGIQGHWSVGDSLAEVEQAIKKYAELGLEIHITELDIGTRDTSAQGLARQAEYYRQAFTLFKKYSDVITSVTLWGISDAATWRPNDNPLLFDKKMEPKPAFWAIVDTDKSWEENKAYYLGE